MSDTNWIPVLSDDGPRYRALADAIADAVDDGGLTRGDRLPPVRTLAWKLGVTPGTVARAYQLAEHRGVLEAHVGRGTFVSGGAPVDSVWSPTAIDTTPARLGPTPDAAWPIDFRLNRAPDVGQSVEITEAMQRLIAARVAMPLADYHRYGEDAEERAAGVEWLRSGGVPARIEDTVICSGAQHGMLTALAATVGGGDAIALTEPLIHPGLKDCARALGLRLEPVEMDEEGFVPDALDAACARWRPGAILLTVNLQNPLLVTTSPKRREAIAEIAQRRRVSLVEDDVYGWLENDRAPSMASYAPELTWYVASLSKCVAAGIRAGYVVCPPGEGPRAARLLQGYTQHVSWMVSALAAELIRSGDLGKIVERVRAETIARSRMVSETLYGVGGIRVKTAKHSTMAWLTLPEPWRASDFVSALSAAGVLASPAEVFAVGRAPAPHAVRIGVGNATNQEEVATGLASIVETLRTGPTPGSTID